ncbi:MAG: DUF4126 domain-containing protein [Flavobacteriales bacterium]|nr:DUF4126 domain-containing protein [Flavobacteriales bacterium]HPJ51618.1 DUF4126 domain-containing protein [Flavobacteriales bacterium]
MDWLISIALGVGLAAATGFRVFLPLFVVSLLAHLGLGGFAVNEDFAWLGSLPAVIAFGAATLVEVLAYAFPFVDNLLDTLAVPLAAAAGTLIALGTMVDLPPLVLWSVALIAGGGMAGAIKGGAAATRLASSVKTAGMGNPIVAVLETGMSVLLTVIALVLPLLALVIVATLAWQLVRWVRRL